MGSEGSPLLPFYPNGKAGGVWRVKRSEKRSISAFGEIPVSTEEFWL